MHATTKENTGIAVIATAEHTDMIRAFSDALEDFLHTEYNTILNGPRIHRLSRNKLEVPVTLLYAKLNSISNQFIR